MAIWQYRFSVIPKDSVSSDSFKPQYDEEGLLEDVVYWLSFHVSAAFFEDFEKILPRSNSWSKDLLLFGSEESNCLEVYSENEQIVSVSLRVDYSSDYEYFIRVVIEFVYLNSLLLLDEDNKVVEANYLSIKEIIENSQQFGKYKKLMSS